MCSVAREGRNEATASEWIRANTLAQREMISFFRRKDGVARVPARSGIGERR